MLRGNQMSMGIQSKSVRGLGAEPSGRSVRSTAPHEPGVSWGGAPLTQETLETIFFHFVFALKFDEMFSSDFFPIFLESSETHFDLIESKKFHNIIYGDIVVYFFKNFQLKMTI